MNNLDKQYTDLLKTILEHGVDKKDRTGTGTKSIFGYTIRHNMKDGFPLLTTKKMPFKIIVTELLWFLRGDTNIKYLVDNNCHIWDGDAYKNYVKTSEPTLDGKYLSQPEFIHWIKTDDEFAEKWGELGPIYGAQWRNWKGFRHGWHDVAKVINGSIEPHIDWLNGIDQIQNLINDLKTNPDSRRLMVNAWNVGEIDQMVLPPCHYGFQVYTRELSYDDRFKIAYKNLELRKKLEAESAMLHYPIGHNKVMDEYNIPTRAISLMWNQRSLDTFLGLPFNIASYGLLLMMIADEVGMVPDQLIGNLGDVHLYSNHIEQAKEQIGRHYTIEERVALIPEGVLSPESVEYFNLNKKTNSEINVALAKYNISPGLHTRRPFPLPTVHVRDGIYCSSHSDVLLFDYQSHPAIKAPLSN